MVDEEHAEVQIGTSLAQAALVAALISAMRAKGLFSQAEVDAVFEAALLGVENGPMITPTANTQARVLLDALADEMSGRRSRPA